MNYKDLFARSWSLIWKHPPLWVYALLVEASSLLGLLPRTYLNCILLPALLACLLIGYAGLTWMVYDIERGNQPGVLRTWNAVKGSLVALIIAGISIYTLALLLTIPIALLWYIFAPRIPADSVNSYLRALFPILVFGVIGVVLSTFPSCRVLFQKSADLGDDIHAGLKLTFKKIGPLLAIYLLSSGIGLCVMVFSGSIAAVVHGITWNELSQMEAFQAYVLVITTPTSRILSALCNFVLSPLFTTATTLAYLEFAGQEEK